MKRLQKGFTLIELMIVIAIIAILAAVALPAYQNYVGRSQLSEAMVLADGARVSVADAWTSSGIAPTDNTTAHLASSASISGKYVSNVAVGAGGVITATMAGSGVATCVQSAALVLTPSFPAVGSAASINWHCSSSATPACVPASCN